MSDQRLRTRYFTAIVLLFSISLLINAPAAAQPTAPACSIILEVDPPTPLEMNEGERIVLIVKAHYSGDKKVAVRLAAQGLPEFVTGWSDNHDYCRDCTISDTLYIEPGFCDAGEHKFDLVAHADYRKGLEDKIVYHIKVHDTDHECLLIVEDSYEARVGEELAFPIEVIDQDRPCKDTPRPRWYYHGYPFEHGADLLPGDYRRVFTWTPDASDIGTHQTSFKVYIAPSECERIVEIVVRPDGPQEPDCVEGPPLTREEPPFTPGTSNEICYVPNCDAFEHQVCYFDSMAPSEILGCDIPIFMTAEEDLIDTCVTIVNLLDGHTYGYFATAYFIEYPDSFLPSADTVYSTQDASPPDPITTTTAEPDSGGVIIVKWYGVTDAVSYVKKYEVYRKPTGGDYILDTVIPPVSGNDELTKYTYRDSLGSGSGLVEGQPYHYKVVAVDAVGNRGSGNETGPVIPDATPPCRPYIRITYDYRFIFANYKQGVESEVAGRSICPDPTPLNEANYMRFEGVRDNIGYFPVKWKPYWNYFESPWLPYDADFEEWLSHLFDLLPESGDTSYVNGHWYYFRIQAKDEVGNISTWSRIDSVMMDAYPPSDIVNLTVEPKFDRTHTTFGMALDWNPATDEESGVKCYRIYRKLEGEDTFSLIADSVYTDSYEDNSIQDLDLERGVVCYRVGSSDNVGNIRNWQNTSWEACAYLPIGPVIHAECDTTIDETCYVGGDYMTLSWPDYDNTDVDYYEVERHYDGKDTIVIQDDPAQLSIDVPIPGTGWYTARVHAVFLNGIQSTWSNTVTFYKDGIPPDPVTDLVVSNESGRYFELTWTKPYDNVGVWYYKIWRRTEAAEWGFVGIAYAESYADSFCDSPDFTTYEYYTYKVEPVDLLENVQTEGNAEIANYCNRPPIFTLCERQGDSILVWWQRKDEDRPTLSSAWRDTLCVFKDFSLIECVVIEYDYRFIYKPDEMGFYSFIVKEVPTDLDNGRETAWSDTCTVAYDVTFPVISDFAVQLHEIDVAGGEDQDRTATLSWIYPDFPGSQGFVIDRWRDGTPEASIYVASHSEAYYEYTDPSLSPDCEYQYCITVDNRYTDEEPCESCALVSTKGGEGTPENYIITQNYPNPFNPETRIEFQLPTSCLVLLRIFNVKGEVVRTLVNEDMAQGSYGVTWDGTNDLHEPVASGIYFYQIKTPLHASSRKIVLLR